MRGLDRRKALALGGAACAAPAVPVRADSAMPENVVSQLARRIGATAAGLHADLVDDRRLPLCALEAGTNDPRAYLVAVQIGRLLEGLDAALAMPRETRAEMWRVLARQAARQVEAADRAGRKPPA